MQSDKHDSIRRGGRKRRYNLGVRVEQQVLANLSLVVLFFTFLAGPQVRFAALAQSSRYNN